MTVLAQDERIAVLIVSMDSGGRRGSRWGDWWCNDDTHTGRQSAHNPRGWEAWAQSAGDRPSVTDQRNTTHHWSGQQYWPSEYSNTAASSTDRNPPQATVVPAYTKTKRGKRGGQMSKNVSSADARTPEQHQRAVRREEYIEATIWVKVNNDADPDPCFLQTWLQAVRKRIAHVKAMREQAASVQDSHDDEPVSDISEPATCSECSDDESDAELVLQFGDEIAMNLNRSVPGFEVFKSSDINESEQYYKLDPAVTWETKYVVLPGLSASRTSLNRVLCPSCKLVRCCVIEWFMWMINACGTTTR